MNVQVSVYVRTPSDECPGVRVAPVGNDRLQVIQGHQILQIKIFNDFDGAKSSFTYQKRVMIFMLIFVGNSVTFHLNVLLC